MFCEIKDKVMSLCITLKVAPRTSRRFELPITEEELGDLRRAYWTAVPRVSSTFSTAEARVKAILAAYHDHSSNVSILSDQEVKVTVRAITSLSLWVGGIYWYRDRTPPVSEHTRVRAFFDSDGQLKCPKCGCLLCEDFNDYHEKPVDFSKTLNNPRFICPHCNSLVMVSQRSSAYRLKLKSAK